MGHCTDLELLSAYKCVIFVPSKCEWCSCYSMGVMLRTALPFDSTYMSGLSHFAGCRSHNTAIHH